MNLRRFAGVEKPFATFNREERNLAAIFFFALNLDGNMSRFLAAAGCQPPQAGWEPTVYFEFTYVRDIWKQIATNEQRRALILRFLRTTRTATLAHCSVEEFNGCFIGEVFKDGIRRRGPSTKYIESPSNWGLAQYDKTIDDNESFHATCMFKWAFNAKPDLVIQTGPDQCVCVEAKLESREGQYPSNSEEKKIFKRRGLDFVGQTTLQQFALADLLGFETEFVFLARKPPKSEGHRFLSWASAFDAMETGALPAYMKQTIAAMTT